MTHCVDCRTRFVFRLLVLFATVANLAAAQFLFAPTASADPFPPTWGGGTGPAVHDAPVAWPNEPANPLDCGETCGDWQPYPYFQVSAKDPRIQDPSNGGTSPQNYVNISSSCVDQAKPSVYYYLDTANQVLLFRWRVEQIANNYATGPTPGTFGATNPWNSGLWTVFFDINGDGFRDLAAHLNGSSGDPATAVDRVVGIWGNIPSNQSLDYPNDPNIHLLGHNPTGFVDAATARLLNFRSSVSPAAQWPNGAAERTWDYGTTRSRLVTKANADGATCDEYFVDYQIPLAMLDAATLGGPAVEPNLPLSMLFCTANSLNNPFQKDCLYQGAWIGDPSKPAPFGDYLTLGGAKIVQPIVDDITAAGCGPVQLGAKAKDTLHVVNGATMSSLAAVDFYYYADTNGDSLANDGSTWTLAAEGTRAGLNRWTAQWSNSSPLLSGAYLIGVQAVDSAGNNPDGKANRTFSYLTPSEVAALTPPGGENWLANPPVTGAKATAFDVNTCGAPPPYVTKQAGAASAPAGSSLPFTITVHNTRATPLTVSAVTDQLPPGFSFATTSSSSLGTPGTQPSAAATGTITWTFAPPAVVPAASTRDLVFTATASLIAGSYNNVAFAMTGEGMLASEPLPISVGAPRLTIAKSAGATSLVPGDLVTYTISYANQSPVDVTGALITDVVPSGLGSVNPLDGGVYNNATREIVWQAGTLAAGEGPYGVRFVATVDNPYTAAVPLINTATIASQQTAPADATSSTFVNMPRPRLLLQKSVSPAVVAPGEDVVFTLQYQNAGDALAAGVVITDPIPAGFTFVSATNGGAAAGGQVQWNLGNVAAGAAGSVQLVLEAADPYAGANPQVNTGWISSPQTGAARASAMVGIQGGNACSTFYFHDDTANVGEDGTQKLALAQAPLAGDTNAGTRITAPGNSDAYAEVTRFYQDPAAPGDIVIAGPITTSFYIDRQNGPGLFVRATVYDYDSATGDTKQLGQSTTEFLGSERGLLEYVVDGNGTLQAGHRLLWVFEGRSKTSQTVDVLFQYGGTVPNSVSDTTLPIATTFADSRSVACAGTPAALVLEKRVSRPFVTGGDILSYTLAFTNVGGAAAVNVAITDTLDANLTYVGAALNGAQVPAPLRTDGQQVVFAVNTAAQPAGTAAAGAGGLLVLTATVAAPLPADVTTLLNSAAIAGEGLFPVTATAESQVGQPLLTVAKRVDKGILRPGDRATYAVLVQNAGTFTATNVAVNDVLPVQAYYTYVVGSTAVNRAAVADAVTAGVLNLPLGELAPGATALVTFQMQVAAGGVPDGVTVLENSAAVASTQTPAVTSEVAVVSINTNPSLLLSKFLAAPNAPAAGDSLTYTLIVTNTGVGDALGVEVVDPIPARTSYLTGTLRYQGVLHTDSADADNGSFATAANRVRFAVGTLPQGASAAMSFQVQLDGELPSGTTPFVNAATASAANAVSMTAQVVGAAGAAPLLTIDKRGPAAVGWPAAVVVAPLAPTGAPAAAGAGASTTFQVDSAAQLAVGQYVVLGGKAYRITGLASKQVTVEGSANAAPGTPVIPGFAYAITYRNEGRATATNVVLIDTLPAGLTYLAAVPAATVDGATLTWHVGALAPGEAGAVELVVFPTGPGVYLNHAAIDSDETPPAADDATTAVGGLVVGKRTTTPAVVLTQAGAAATYVVEVQNTLPTAVGGVVVTDTLPPGFIYHGTVAISGGTRTLAAPQPLAGSEQPAWGAFSIPANGTLAITFTVDILPSTGPAIYQNAVTAAAPGAAVVGFDELLTPEEDVEVLVTVLAIEAKVTYYAWLDQNGDGLQDVTESGVAGVTADLLDGAGNVVRTAVTDAFGRCTFAMLPPGTYSVQTLLPPSYGFTQQDAMANFADFVDSDAAPGTGKSAAFTLAAGDHKPTLAAGLTLPAAPAGIAGRAWHDTNHNGVQDAGETGIGGITAMVYRGTGGAGSTLVATLQTGTEGDYAVQNLLPGSYYVQFAAPAGYTVSPRDAGGSDATDSDADPANGATAPTSLAAGQHAAAWDLGLYLPVAPARLNGRAWIDYDGNGNQDPAEPPAGGVEVTLYRTTGEPLATTATGVDGAYRFDNLAPGAYYVHFGAPDGYVRAPQDGGSDDAHDSDSGQETGRTATYLLVAGESNSTVDAGYSPLLTAGGMVFNDFRNNGVYDANEDFGIDGVLVNVYADVDGSGKLSPADGLPLAGATTAGAGVYRFAGLPAGDYILALDPANFSSGGLLNRFVSSLKASPTRAEPEIDPDDDVDGDDNGYNDVREGAAMVLSRAVTLAAYTEPVNDGDGNAGSNLALDFGIYDPSVGDSAWWDVNKDGVQDAGEPGLGGLTLNLFDDSNGSGELDAGDLLRKTVTSLVDGAYVFTFLAPGEYLVQVAPLNFAPGGVLYQWSPTAGGSDPDDDDNTDSNGALSPLGGVVAKALTLTSSGEPSNDGDGDEYTNLSLDFGFWPNPGVISGLAWQDSDGDGRQEGGEARLAGITVTLYSTSNTVLATRVTGSDGGYQFSDLPPGEYYELFTPPAGRRLTVSNSGGDEQADSDAEADGRTGTILLVAGGAAAHWDVGLLAPTGEEELPEPVYSQSLYLPAINR